MIEVECTFLLAHIGSSTDSGCGVQTMLIQPAPLTVRGVFKSLHNVAKQKGAGATARRRQSILHLLRSCRCLPYSSRSLLLPLQDNTRHAYAWCSSHIIECAPDYSLAALAMQNFFNCLLAV